VATRIVLQTHKPSVLLLRSFRLGDCETTTFQNDAAMVVTLVSYVLGLVMRCEFCLISPLTVGVASRNGYPMQMFDQPGIFRSFYQISRFRCISASTSSHRHLVLAHVRPLLLTAAISALPWQLQFLGRTLPCVPFEDERPLADNGSSNALGALSLM
jgi:hypothetical protein